MSLRSDQVLFSCTPPSNSFSSHGDFISDFIMDSAAGLGLVAVNPNCACLLAKWCRLSILDTPHLCADFLSALALTPEDIVKIRITGFTEVRADLSDIPALFASLLPADRSALSWLAAALSVYVDNWWGNRFIECRAGRRQTERSAGD